MTYMYSSSIVLILKQIILREDWPSGQRAGKAELPGLIPNIQLRFFRLSPNVVK